jgi:hypothetical protein
VQIVILSKQKERGKKMKEQKKMNSAKPLITLLTPRGKKKAETKGR